MRFFYFGCLGGYGHFLHEVTIGSLANPRRIYQLGETPFGTMLDGGLCPTDSQEEGRAIVHCLGFWTALSFWDRSVDHRSGSNSNFVVQAPVPFDEMLVLARQQFPQVMNRFRFPIIDVTLGHLPTLKT